MLNKWPCDCIACFCSSSSKRACNEEKSSKHAQTLAKQAGKFRKAIMQTNIYRRARKVDFSLSLSNFSSSCRRRPTKSKQTSKQTNKQASSQASRITATQANKQCETRKAKQARFESLKAGSHARIQSEQRKKSNNIAFQNMHTNRRANKQRGSNANKYSKGTNANEQSREHMSKQNNQETNSAKDARQAR